MLVEGLCQMCPQRVRQDGISPGYVQHESGPQSAGHLHTAGCLLCPGGQLHYCWSVVVSKQNVQYLCHSIHPAAIGITSLIF